MKQLKPKGVQQFTHVHVGNDFSSQIQSYSTPCYEALPHIVFSTRLFLTLDSGCETSPAEKGVVETYRSFPRAHWTGEQRWVHGVYCLSVSLPISTCVVRIVWRCVCLLVAHRSARYNKQINKMCDLSTVSSLPGNWFLTFGFFLSDHFNSGTWKLSCQQTKPLADPFPPRIMSQWSKLPMQEALNSLG